MKKRLTPQDTPPKLNKRKIVFVGAVVIFHLFLLCWFIRSDFTLIMEIRDGEFHTGKYKFMEEDFDNPRLRLLRKRENLDKVIASGRTQFEKIVLLRKWAHSQWQGRGASAHYPPWDALEIIDLAKKYKSYGFCAQYAIVFLQACQAVGLHARYVDLPGHFVTAVWSDEYNRWVIMDPSNDLHFEKNGMPLSGRDLCNAYWEKGEKWIYKVGSDGKKTKVVRGDIACYRMYSIVLRANHLSDPIEIEINGSRGKLTLSPDYRTYPLIGKDNIGFGDNSLAWKEKDATEYFSDKRTTEDPDDFRFAENQTIIFLAQTHEGKAKIKLLAENSPDFRVFSVNLDGTGWREYTTSVLVWTLKSGYNKLSARVLTKSGWQGHESYIKLIHKKSWLNRRPV